LKGYDLRSPMMSQIRPPASLSFTHIFFPLFFRFRAFCVITTVITTMVVGSHSIVHAAPSQEEADPVEWHLIRDGASLRLLARSCTFVNRTMDTFDAWKRRHGEQPGPRPALRNFSGYCTADVTGLLPSKIAPLIHAHSFFSGPNSWNAVLIEARVVNIRRYTDETEFRSALASPLCRPIPSGEDLRLGDIGAIRARPDPKGPAIHAHAFTRLDQDLIYTKDDLSYDTPYAIQSISHALQLFKLDTAPVECRDERNDNNTKCGVWLEYFRCRPKAEVTAQLGWSVPPRARALTERASRLEARVSGYTLGTERYNDDLQQGLAEEVVSYFNENDALETAVLEELGPQEGPWFFLSSLRSTFISLAYQVSGLTTGMRPQGEETIWYKHEPWQGVILSPAFEPGSSPQGPVVRWLTCLPGQRCQRPAATSLRR